MLVDNVVGGGLLKMAVHYFTVESKSCLLSKYGTVAEHSSHAPSPTRLTERRRHSLLVGGLLAELRLGLGVSLAVVKFADVLADGLLACPAF
jgi:hypothetical protein